MSEMIERVALAIATKVHVDSVKFNLGQINQTNDLEQYLKIYPVKISDSDRDLARVVIEAMREPTDEMCEAAEWHQQSEVNQYYRAIDAALSTPAESPVDS